MRSSGSEAPRRANAFIRVVAAAVLEVVYATCHEGQVNAGDVLDAVHLVKGISPKRLV